MIIKPRLPEFSTGARRTSPHWAYTKIFLATSEIAVATRVESLGPKPRDSASVRPRCRAATISKSERIDTTISSWAPAVPTPVFEEGSGSDFIPIPGSRSLRRLLRPQGLHFLVQVTKPLFQIERGGDIGQVQAQLHQGEGDVGLDADDHGFGAAQPDHVRDVAQRAGRERIHHVQSGDVHDHALRAHEADL